MAERQQVLHLWLAAAALDTDVKAWAFHDGAEGAGSLAGVDASIPSTEPPYRTGVDALADGWFLLQAPGPLGLSAIDGELPCEFVFERRVIVAFGSADAVD